MGELCAILGVLAVVLLVVAVVGHVIWLVIAAIFRAITGKSAEYEPPPKRIELGDDAITARKLQKLYRDGKIDLETFQKVMGAMQPQMAAQRPVIPLQRPPVMQPPPPLAAVEEIPDVDGFALAPSPSPAPPPLPVARQVIPITPVAPPKPPPPPPPPRKPFSEIFKRFMEESNIRWGELIGGLLIIGCSIALVLTFWEQISTQPWLRFFLFTAVTSAIFGTGLYTEHRWKLPTTSRGLLLIATLLVPLNFLAFSRGGASSGAAAQELVALALFAWLVWTAGKVLVGAWTIPLAIGVLGPSIVQSLIGRMITPQSTDSLIMLLALLAVAFYAVCNGWVLNLARRFEELDWSKANQTLLVLGASAFALTMPLTVLAVKAQDWFLTTRHIAPAITLAAVPILAAGLLLWRRVKAIDMAGMQTAAIAIAMLGVFVVFGGIALSWPDPGRMIGAALVAFVTLSLIALFFDIPQAHLLALPCLALVYVLAFHLLQPASHPHHIAWSAQENLARVVFSGSTGSSLIGLVFLLALAGEWLFRRNRREAPYYAVGAAGLAVLSLILITLFGFAQKADFGATWIYLAYAGLALWFSWRSGHSDVAWVAVVLLGFSLVQSVGFRFNVGRNWLDRWALAALLHASILVTGLLLTWLLAEKRHKHLFIPPLSGGALLSSCIASACIILALIFSEPLPSLWLLGLRFAWVAVVVLGVAVVHTNPILFSAFQTAFAAAVVLGTAGFSQHQAWFTSADHPLAHPWTIQSAAIALALLSFAWTLFRLAAARISWSKRVNDLLGSSRPTTDALFAYLALIVLILSALIAIIPAVAHELSRSTARGHMEFSWLISHTAGPRAWLLLVSTILALLASLWIGFRRTTILALLVCLAAACAFASATFDSQNSSASALRWSLSILFLLGSLLLWWREPLLRVARRMNWKDFEYAEIDLPQMLRVALLALTTVPILAITFYSAVQSLLGNSVVGPASGSFFARMGNSLNYLIPLALMIALFIGHAWRERSSSFAFTAAVLLNITVTLGYMLYLVTGHHPVGAVQAIHLLQFNAIAAAAFAIGWRLALRNQPGPNLLSVQSAIAPLLLISLLAVFQLQLIANPSSLSPAASQTAGWIGCLAWLLAAGAVVNSYWTPIRRNLPLCAFASLLIISSLASLRLVSTTATPNWLPYHALLGFSALCAWLMLALGAGLLWKNPRQLNRDQITTFTIAFAAITLFLSLRAIWGDPARPWWTVYGLLSLSPLAIALAFWTMRSSWLYPAGLLVNIALSIGWIFGRHPAMASSFLGLAQLNILVLAAGGLALLVLELYILRPLRSQVVHVGILAFHHFAAIASLIGMLFVVFASMAADILSLTATTNAVFTWSAPAATLALLIATLWDRDARYSLWAIYVQGLLIAAVILHAFHFRLEDLTWIWVVIIAGYSVLLSYLYMFRSSLAQFAESISIPPRERWPAQHPGWVGTLTLFQATAVFVVSFFAVQLLSGQLPRLCVAAGAISSAVAVGLLAHDSNQNRLRSATLTLGLFGAILWGWAWLPRYGPDVFLNRVVIVMVATAAMSVFYAIGLVKILRRENEWTAAARRLVPLLAIATVLSVFLVLVSEMTHYRPGIGAPMALWAFAAFALALVAMAVAAMICAIVPGRDPFNLSERARQIYVYATELLAVLLFVHVVLVHPQLLQFGIWNRFWPIIVMALAFAGIGLSELFRRQGRSVLAQPLENTSILLPLLPVIAFWLLNGVWEHQQHVNYALVLLLAGAAYGALAMLRRSFIFGLLSALAGNGALWYLLSHSPTLGFFQHPQLWLIPVSLSILAAAYLNRQRLAPAHMRNLRYLCLMTIYASSTADIILNGINQAPWLPMVLAVLAVGGVLAGILLRVQSFLFLGTLFLLVALATMIQYAAFRVGQNWPWLVAGILLGSAIIVLFALFEKKREEMLGLVDGLKEWQA